MKVSKWVISTLKVTLLLFFTDVTLGLIFEGPYSGMKDILQKESEEIKSSSKKTCILSEI